MTTIINKAGTDWIVTKRWLNDKIDDLHVAMEGAQDFAQYNYLRGQIALAKALIEHVEPTAPPQTIEDDYEISTPGTGPY